MIWKLISNPKNTILIGSKRNVSFESYKFEFKNIYLDRKDMQDKLNSNHLSEY